MKRITLSVKKNLRDCGQNGPGILTLGDQFWFKCLTNLPFTLKFWGGYAVSRILRINEWVWHLLFKVIRVIGGGKLSRVMTWCTCQRNVGVALCIFICYLLHMWLVPSNLGLHLTSVIKIKVKKAINPKDWGGGGGYQQDQYHIANYFNALPSYHPHLRWSHQSMNNGLFLFC